MKLNKLTLLFSTMLITLLIGAFATSVSSAPSILKVKAWWKPKSYTLWKPVPDPWKAVVGFPDWPKHNASEIDPSTILLEGKYKPKSAPYLILKGVLLVVPFDGRDVLEALLFKVTHTTPGLYRINLEISGRLYDGTPFQGSGVITLTIVSS